MAKARKASFMEGHKIIELLREHFKITGNKNAIVDGLNEVRLKVGLHPIEVEKAL